MTTTDTAPAPVLGASRVYEQMLTDEKWAAIVEAAAVPVPSEMTLDEALLAACAPFTEQDQAGILNALCQPGFQHMADWHAECRAHYKAQTPVPISGAASYPEPKWEPAPLPVRDPGASLPAALTLADLAGKVERGEVKLAAAPVLPPAQEAALERFTAAHDAEDAEPRTAVIDLDGEDK